MAYTLRVEQLMSALDELMETAEATPYKETASDGSIVTEKSKRPIIYKHSIKNIQHLLGREDIFHPLDAIITFE